MLMLLIARLLYKFRQRRISQQMKASLWVIAAVILVGTPLASASSGSHNTTTADSTATTGDSTSSSTTEASSANNNVSVERGAAYSAPSLGNAEVGTEVVQLHSFLGGATFANTELDTRVRLKIEVIIDAYEVGLIDEDTAKARIGLALNDMDSIQKERRVPLLGFSCNHRTLFNVFGLLCN